MGTILLPESQFIPLRHIPGTFYPGTILLPQSQFILLRHIPGTFKYKREESLRQLTETVEN